jgi:exopolysaccharide biosynthesis polyprenyl glycosylphosphotransferase
VSPVAGFGFILVLIAVGLALTAGRQLLYQVVQRLRPEPLAVSRAIVLGTKTQADPLVESEVVKLDRRLVVLGHVTCDGQIDPRSMGALSDLVWIIERHDVDTIILADHLDDDILADVLEVAERSGCLLVAGYPFFSLHGFIPRVTRRNYVPYVTIVRPSLRVAQLVSKRIFDIVAAVLLLLVLSPICLLIALVVRISSRGPVIFGQTRIGYAGIPFHMYKFRSMVNGADDMKVGLQDQSIYSDARTFKILNDPRITRFGRFLRRASLDELPQLCNVLKGDMSLVGPRPPLPEEVDQYEEHNYSRFDMKPGITGPWQVSGRNHITDFEQIVALETDYLTDWSLPKDFAILLRTIPAVFSMKGAL